MAAILCNGMNQFYGRACQKINSLQSSCNNKNNDATRINGNNHSKQFNVYDTDVNPKSCGASTTVCSTATSTYKSMISRWCNWCPKCETIASYLSTLKSICTNPFGIFVTVTVVSNLPPMLIAITEIGSLFSFNTGICPASIWLFINFLFCWLHIIASLYIAISINHRFRHNSHYSKNNNNHNNYDNNVTNYENNNSYTNNNSNSKTIYKRASNLFCYDPTMALYIMTVVVYFVFIFVPQLLKLDNAQQVQHASCTIYIHEKVIATVGFAWAFLTFGLGALVLSFGFAYVDATRQEKFMQTIMSGEDNNNNNNNNNDGRILENTSTVGTYTSMDEETGNQYRPPTIGNTSTLEDANVDFTASSTEETTNTQRKQKEKQRHRKRQVILQRRGKRVLEEESEDDGEEEEGFTTEMETTVGGGGGFVTDFETDIDDLGVVTTYSGDETSNSREEHTAGTPTTTATRNKRGRSFGTTTVSYYDDEEDEVPITSYEVQETDTEGGFTTDRYMGETTDAGPSFETNEIEDAIDLTDMSESIRRPTTTKFNKKTDKSRSSPSSSSKMKMGDMAAIGAANLDMVLAVSQDESVSNTLTEEGGTSVDDGSVTGSVTSKKSIISLFARRGGKEPLGKKKPIKSSSSTTNKPPSLPTTNKPPSSSTNKKTEAPVTRRQKEHAQYANATKTTERVANLVADDDLESCDSDNYHDNIEEPTLTYSTSIGNNEPLSFVDGGSCNDDGPPNPRYFHRTHETNEERAEKRKRKS